MWRPRASSSAQSRRSPMWARIAPACGSAGSPSVAAPDAARSEESIRKLAKPAGASRRVLPPRYTMVASVWRRRSRSASTRPRSPSSEVSQLRQHAELVDHVPVLDDASIVQAVEVHASHGQAAARSARCRGTSPCACPASDSGRRRSHPRRSAPPARSAGRGTRPASPGSCRGRPPPRPPDWRRDCAPRSSTPMSWSSRPKFPAFSTSSNNRRMSALFRSPLKAPAPRRSRASSPPAP